MRYLLASVAILVVACGGGGAPTRAPTPAATVGVATPPSGSGDEALCVLTPADWQQFNYVTSASPDVTSDEPGTAICQYASGLFLEMYTHENEDDALTTLETVRENAPFEDDQEIAIPGAGQVNYDPDLGDNHAGIVVQAGRLTFAIYGLARDSSQVELTTLAGLVLARSASLI
jgi:hypothetical protein